MIKEAKSNFLINNDHQQPDLIVLANIYKILGNFMRQDSVNPWSVNETILVWGHK